MLYQNKYKLNQVDVGTIIEAPSTFSDPNYLPCDGRYISQAAYPILYNKLETPHNLQYFYPTQPANRADQYFRDSGSMIYANSKYLAISYNSTYETYSSSDGNTWTYLGVYPGSPTGICYSSSLSLYAGLINGGTSCFTSTDGVSWTNRSFVSNITSIAWNQTAGVFCTSHATNTSFYTSTDGISWTQRTGPTNGGTLIACDGTTFVTISPSLGTGGTSANGVNWANRTIPTTQGYSNLIWVPAPVSLFIAYSSSYPTYITSPNGISWTLRTFSLPLSFSQKPNSLCWDGSKIILLTGSPSTSWQPLQRIYTSTDGITWSGGYTTTSTFSAICSDGFGNIVIGTGQMGKFGSTVSSVLYALYKNVPVVSGYKYIPNLNYYNEPLIADVRPEKKFVIRCK